MTSEHFPSENQTISPYIRKNKSTIQEIMINKVLKNKYEFEDFKIDENDDSNIMKISRVSFFYESDLCYEINLKSQKKEIIIDDYMIKIIKNYEYKIHLKVSKSLPKENFEEDFYLYKNKYYLDTKIDNFSISYLSDKFYGFEKLIINLNKIIKNGYFLSEPKKEFSFLYNTKKRIFSYEEENTDFSEGYHKFMIGESRDNNSLDIGNSSKYNNSKLVYLIKNHRDPIIFTNSKGKVEEIISCKSNDFISFNESISSIQSPILHIIQEDNKSHLKMLDFNGTIGYLEKIKYLEFCFQNEYSNLRNVKIFPECIFQTDILLINKKFQILDDLNCHFLDHNSDLQPRNIVCSKDCIIIGVIKSYFDFHGALDQIEIRLKIIRKIDYLKERPIICFLIFSCTKTPLTTFKKNLIKELENKYKSEIYILFYENDFLGWKEDKLVDNVNPIKTNSSINPSDNFKINEKQNFESIH